MGNELLTTEGPLGFPLTDRQAIALESIIKALPKDSAYRYRKAVSPAAAPSELLTGERSDVSWISTQDPDRDKEVVIARGMNDGQYKLNPIVTLQHCYHQPPVGRSLWRKATKDGDLVGVKAKTIYPAKPADWPDPDWPADGAFSLVSTGLLNGKSIGFLPLKMHVPDDKERDKNGWSASQVNLVFDQWLLLEYACVYLPCQQNATVQDVSKRLKGEPAPPRITRLCDIETAVAKRIEAIDLADLARRATSAAIDRRRGRI